MDGRGLRFTGHVVLFYVFLTSLKCGMHALSRDPVATPVVSSDQFPPGLFENDYDCFCGGTLGCVVSVLNSLESAGIIDCCRFASFRYGYRCYGAARCITLTAPAAMHMLFCLKHHSLFAALVGSCTVGSRSGSRVAFFINRLVSFVKDLLTDRFPLRVQHVPCRISPHRSAGWCGILLCFYWEGLHLALLGSHFWDEKLRVVSHMVKLEGLQPVSALHVGRQSAKEPTSRHPFASSAHSVSHARPGFHGLLRRWLLR